VVVAPTRKGWAVIFLKGWGGWWALLGDTDGVSELLEIGNGFTRDISASVVPTLGSVVDFGSGCSRG